MTTYSPRSPIRTTDPLRIDTQALAAYVVRLGAERVTETRAYIDAVVSGALQLQLDPTVLLAQWWVETDAGRSVWWKSRLNAAGLGITGDADQNAASQMWTTGTDSAIAHIAHMCSYVYGSGTFARWPATWPDVLLIDKRFPAPIAAGYSASVLDDLTNTWAVDNRYGQKLADRANAIARDFADEVTPAVEPEGDDMAVTFGRVPKPASINRHIPTKQNTAWDNLGKRAKPPDAVTWHRMIGTLNGTDNYFRTFANARQTKVGALTPIGIGVAETDGKTLAGTIFEWNLCESDTENRAGWANGSVKSPYGDGKKYLDLFGINAVNRDIEAMEISGNYNTPLDPASRDAIVAWTAWRADQYGAWLKERGETFDFTTFPLIPSQNNRSYVVWHQEFTIGTGKVCPGEVVIRETPALLARVADMLRQYQTGEPAPAPAPPAPDPLYAQPIPIPALLQQDWTGDTTPAVVTEEGTEFIFVNDVVRATVELPRRQQARNDSPVIGPTIPAGTEFTVSWVFRSRSDGKLWYLTPWWTRTPVAQVERVKDAA